MPANALLAVSLMALITAHVRFATDKFWANPGWLGRACLSIIAVMAMGYLGVQEFRLGKEAYWLDRADLETRCTDQRFAELTSAYEAEPDNFETAYALGEFYRIKSWQADPGYQALAKEALVWFGRAMTLNSYDPLSPLRYGMCLDWLGRHEEATHYFELARRRDPNGSYVAVYEGWHYMELHNYVEARGCFERSLNLGYNELAAGYLERVNERLARAGNPLKN